MALKQPSLRPSDIAVAFWIARAPASPYLPMAQGLYLGVAEVHRGVRRLEAAGLVEAGERHVNRQALLEFLVHGVRYVFPPMLGADAQGIPTAAAASPLAGKLPEAPAVVWVADGGAARGRSLVPLYGMAPRAALADEYLYRVLALVDVLRLGQLRERRLAQGLLDEDLSHIGP